MTGAVNDAALRDAYARLLAARASAPADTEVSLEAIVALIERRGGEAERLALLDRVMASPALRAEFDELRAATRRGRRAVLSWRGPAALAASLILVAGIATWTTRARRVEPDPGLMRGGDRGTIRPLTVERAPGDTLRLRWPASSDAREYTVELLDASGTVVATRTTRETFASFDAPAYARATSAWLRVALPGGRERTTPAVALPAR